MSRLISLAAALVATLALGVPSAAAQGAPSCSFILGFKALHADLPLTVGGCLDNQAFAANGDATQNTTHGLLVWRKADNFTAFTDGYHTWIAGPYGLDLRLNTQRFRWESDAGAAGLTTLQANMAIRPALSTVNDLMRRTYETNIPSEHFALELPPVTIANGYGGTLTAAIGGRFPTADGYGQLVYFWEGTRFLGWDTNTESMSIRGVSSPAPGMFGVTYAHYAASDPLCCPSLPPVTITYTWSGSELVPNGTPPTWGRPITVAIASA